jgi:hypothetical protein
MSAFGANVDIAAAVATVLRQSSFKRRHAFLMVEIKHCIDAGLKVGRAFECGWPYSPQGRGRKSRF